ncbi:hypothetical protein SUGI_0263240 [Cryptomeria japonica]|uniref:homeobox-leucine zipper protein HOX11 n=1 Tax=Cryptomeria japonica TaxID=3369 RepID=UPI002408CDEB|nr:homeobox-leucine zipper protein HOX11 [Cryptomeria japonica]GLJ15929.1 hypothetical protein SUGI_0263240 [Cryptomeria japonica]
MAELPYWAKVRPATMDSYGAELQLGICRVEEDLEARSQKEISRGEGPGVPLDLLSLAPANPNSAPLPSTVFSWMKSSGRSERQGIDMNQMPSPSAGDCEYDEEAAVSSPNSTVSSFHMEEGGLCCSGNNKRESDRASWRGSDEEEGDNSRKKLRLSKDQSALLEESFKKHNTLNPKQKIALAKQLNLRPRQVEVWFQNRRARTKLKQTEVDCEFLKRCCENLTEENRRLQKEVQELRALKVSTPLYMQLPAATLTMCPSCERVATATTHRSPWQPMPNASARPVPPHVRS